MAENVPSGLMMMMMKELSREAVCSESVCL